MSKLQQTLLPIKLEESQERLTSLAGLVLVEEWGRAKGIRARVCGERICAAAGVVAACGRAALGGCARVGGGAGGVGAVWHATVAVNGRDGGLALAIWQAGRRACGAADQQRNDSPLSEIVRRRDHDRSRRDDHRSR